MHKTRALKTSWSLSKQSERIRCLSVNGEKQTAQYHVESPEKASKAAAESLKCLSLPPTLFRLFFSS